MGRGNREVEYFGQSKRVQTGLGITINLFESITDLDLLLCVVRACVTLHLQI